MTENNPWICVHGHDSRKFICVDCGLHSVRFTHNYEYKKAKEMTDHAAATVEALEKIIALLRAGHVPEDLGEVVILLGRLMARRT